MKSCVNIGCSQASYGEKCSYRNCEFHPHYDEQYVTKNLCNHPKTWWTCSQCGEVTCRSCHAFKLPTVTHCVNCFKDWLTKTNTASLKEYKEIVRNYVHVGGILWQMIREHLEKGGTAL